MSLPGNDKAFAGSIPEFYETYLVPLLFEPYAVDLATRLEGRRVSRVLETAAGTGVLTRALASWLPVHVEIVATDLNQPMLDKAAALGTERPVEWRQVDAMELPFAEASFDAVFCQFGVMFLPDKVKALAEARRVLRPGGLLLYNVWDRLEENEFAAAISTALAAHFPADPPGFLGRTPYGYHDVARIRGDLGAAGFETPAEIKTLAARSRAASPRDPAVAYCRGTPLSGEIEARDPGGLDRAIDAAAQEIARRCGAGKVDAKIQAFVVTVER